jgi:LPS O-antigen subunit length determinant protein (WzzB/FepE family)
MNEDAYMNWFEYNHQDLQQLYIESSEFEDHLHEFAMKRFESEEADRADYLYEMYKDLELERKAERQQIGVQSDLNAL